MAKPVQEAQALLKESQKQINALLAGPEHVHNLLNINSLFDRISARLTYMGGILEPEKKDPSAPPQFPPITHFMGEKIVKTERFESNRAQSYYGDKNEPNNPKVQHKLIPLYDPDNKRSGTGLFVNRFPCAIRRTEYTTAFVVQQGRREKNEDGGPPVQSRLRASTTYSARVVPTFFQPCSSLEATKATPPGPMRLTRPLIVTSMVPSRMKIISS